MAEILANSEKVSSEFYLSKVDFCGRKIRCLRKYSWYNDFECFIYDMRGCISFNCDRVLNDILVKYPTKEVKFEAIDCDDPKMLTSQIICPEITLNWQYVTSVEKKLMIHIDNCAYCNSEVDKPIPITTVEYVDGLDYKM